METTFTFTITGTEHEEWQGRLKSGGESEASFRSLVELIRIINQALEKEKA